MEKNNTCHQDLIAINHWQCSECGHFEPWCYASSKDYFAGRRFGSCPGCGRTIDWNYWDTHLMPGETWREKLANKITNDLFSEKHSVILEDGLPIIENLSLDLAVYDDAKRLLDDGVNSYEVRRLLRQKYLNCDQDGGGTHE